MLSAANREIRLWIWKIHSLHQADAQGTTRSTSVSERNPCFGW